MNADLFPGASFVMVLTLSLRTLSSVQLHENPMRDCLFMHTLGIDLSVQVPDSEIAEPNMTRQAKAQRRATFMIFDKLSEDNAFYGFF